MGDTLLTDGFPARASAYLRRQHRWTRGDWQNVLLPRSLRRRLSGTDTLRLADCVRRSLTAPANLLAIVLPLLLPGSGLAFAGVCALLSLASGLGGALMAALTRRSGREKHPASRLYGAALALARSLLALLLLPAEAWTELSAGATALWRVLVTKRRLLEWQTAASQERGSLAAALGALWPECAAGAALLFLAPEPAGKTLGLIWLFAPLIALTLTRPAHGEPLLAERDRRFLLSECRKMWLYFAELCTPERGYLPPDNYQVFPPTGAAERTSPTNIALAMAACLAAADMGLENPKRALELLEGMLASCEGLEKWRGHLYNWYDTRTRRPMEPRYVSAVDSGNLAAGLTAVAAGLAEYGRADLAGRAAALRDGMDFAALFDEKRRLFRIGIDVSAGKAGEGCYDLLASEARLTGYYAVAHGDVPLRHWRQLSRALVGKDGYRGLASWTGTMFEYLMPELFLPLERGSLLWESARFCLYVQRRDTPPHLPWGQSESAYFSLDAAMSYRYKAHGCARLALKRGMEADTVCAPYASYLALAAAPGAAVRDLRRFASLDAGGRYGLWEAIDFTPRRTTSRRGESVQCVMAHHLGMSLAASANALTGGVMQRRFMSDPAMAAYSSLLGESAPEGAVLLRRRLYRPLAQSRPRPAAVAAAEGRCSGAAERVFPLSNGVYSLLAAENGLSAGCAGGIAVYRGFDGAPGLRVSLDTGGGRTDLLPLPGREGGLDFRYVLRGGLLRFDGEDEQLASSVSLAVSAQDTAELRITELTSVRPLEGELVFELEPALARAEDYAAHPAYWRLGLEAEERGGALLIRRRPRPGLHGCWLCIAADAPAAFRANIDGEALGALSYPYVSCRVPLSLKAGGTARIRLAIAFAATAEEALDAAGRTLASSPAKLADLVSALGAVSALPQNMLAQLFELAGRLCFARCEGGSPRPRGELWAAGVPGDYPICAVRAEPDGGRAALIASRHRLLALAGIRSELVFIAGDAADYQRPAETAVRRALASAGLEGLTGARGGVFIVSGEHAAAVEGSAAVLLEPDGMPKERRRPSGAQARISRPRRGGAVEHEGAGGEFRFLVRGALPRRAWTLPISNGRFGYLAADCGLGGMWAANSREERINAWICDDRAVSGPETLETLWGGRRLSLFAAEDGHECRVRYGLGYAVWEKLGASVTAFVPSGAAARVLIIENAPGDVLWHSSLQLAAEPRDAAFVVTELAGGLLRAVNPRTGLEFAAAFSVMARAFTCDEAAFLAGELRSERGAALAPCFAAMLPRSERLVIACGCCGAEELVRLAEPDNARRELELVRARFARLCRGAALTTGLGAADAWLDGWAVYQTLVCRLLARTSLYQSGGAYGFRDQLQDAANLLDVDARYARERILDACAHQYDGGDVMHWWHPGKPDRGVRTRISDDLLWLPWAVCEYLDATGDTALLGEEARGIASPPLGADERSRYESAVSSQRAMSVLEHCEAAFGCVLRRGFGSHGLLRMGGGDWCDGFDGVGGESVWLTEFFAHTAERFAPLLDTRSAAALKSAARRCRRGVEAAWDGEWYRRGYYADGRPLGSRESAGCQIDAVAQAWAVFAGCNGDRCDAALTSALERLFDSEGGVVRLFDPPFGDGTEQAGYINGYGEGFRENGGQYTHAAVWLALACLERGRRDDARRLVEAIFSRGESYGAEPFVLAADVYANAARYGEAGWSWYTGAAGWMLRLLKRLREA